MKSIEKGVLYITTGQKYTKEAELSAGSLRKACPDLHVTIFTTDEVDESVFNNIVKIKNEHGDGRIIKSDKIKYMSMTPYEKTIFLDSDTYIANDFSEMFNLLEKFDLAASHAPARINDNNQNQSIPLSFPEINTGVILFLRNSRVKNLFKLWGIEFEKDLSGKKDMKNQPLDQPSFRRALYNSNVRFTILTPEFNCRFISPGYVWGKVYILHGRHNRMDYISGRLNSQGGRKIFFLKSRKKLYFRIKLFFRNIFNEMSVWFY